MSQRIDIMAITYIDVINMVENPVPGELSLVLDSLHKRSEEMSLKEKTMTKKSILNTSAVLSLKHQDRKIPRWELVALLYGKDPSSDPLKVLEIHIEQKNKYRIGDSYILIPGCRNMIKVYLPYKTKVKESLTWGVLKKISQVATKKGWRKVSLNRGYFHEQYLTMGNMAITKHGYNNGIDGILIEYIGGCY